MDWNWTLALAACGVGIVVGLTGMGGGALMTPMLVLLFGIQPLAAVSSDLVAAVVMKPVGGAVHAKRGTVNRRLVGWLAVGSVPAAFAGVLILKSLGTGAALQDRIKTLLGVLLVVASLAMLTKTILTARARTKRPQVPGATRIKPLPTIVIGAIGGLVVGLTSVGSGSLIIVFLMLLYPALSTSELVGTDLVQAIPLVMSAALGHMLFGDFKLGLTAALLVGSLPGVYIGARLSSKANDGLIRPALFIVLVASALKLLNVDTNTVGIAVAVMIAAAVAAALWIRRARQVQAPAPAPVEASITRPAISGLQMSKSGR
jgi:hypothetical protein